MDDRFAVGMGVCLSIFFGFRYNFRNIRFHFRNTFGKMFQGGGAGAGAAVVGGRCTTVDSHIRQVAQVRREFV